jgi:hypothetical protein
MLAADPFGFVCLAVYLIRQFVVMFTATMDVKYIPTSYTSVGFVVAELLQIILIIPSGNFVICE